MEKSIRLSVCLSVSSAAPWLDAWFAGVVPYADEVVVVAGAATDWVAAGHAKQDGRSLDGTEAVIERWARTEPKIVYAGPRVYASRNDQRNVYLRHATGDVLMVLDADEFLHPNAFEATRTLFASKPRLLMLGFPFQQYFTWRRYTEGPYAERAFRRVPELTYPIGQHGGQWVLWRGQKLWRDAQGAPPVCTVHHFNRVADRDALLPRMEYYWKRDGGAMTEHDRWALEKTSAGLMASAEEMPPCVELLPKQLLGNQALMADTKETICETR